MTVLIVILVLIALVVLYVISEQRKLVKLDENINNALSQIGVQQNSRWDALTALLDLTKQYAAHEYQTIMDTVQARKTLTASSTAADVNAQEAAINSTLGKLFAVAEAYPELKASETYGKTMDSVNQFENMVRQSRMIYNDSVTKLNRACRMFPTSIVASALHFAQRDYLEAPAGKTEMPSMH